jgi:mRNA-degrading endonuclease RelE of RelBE toxin-antitoxin system
MQNMDIRMMEKRGLSPMAFKHTPFNQLGSEFLKQDHPIGQFLRGEMLTNIMNSSSAKSFLKELEELKGKYGKKLNDSLKELMQRFRNARKSYLKYKKEHGNTNRITIHPNRIIQ